MFSLIMLRCGFGYVPGPNDREFFLLAVLINRLKLGYVRITGIFVFLHADPAHCYREVRLRHEHGILKFASQSELGEVIDFLKFSHDISTPFDVRRLKFALTLNSFLEFPLSPTHLILYHIFSPKWKNLAFFSVNSPN
ncbi:hypothetical protein WDW37_08975 [Bdellovibrionota bacterium FG-1]